MATHFSEVHTIAAGVTAITLGQKGIPFGDAEGVHHRNWLRVVKHVDTFDAPAELWVDLSGGTAAQDGPGMESVPEKATESAQMDITGIEVRSRVTAAGELEISVWSSGAGDITIEEGSH